MVRELKPQPVVRQRFTAEMAGKGAANIGAGVVTLDSGHMAPLTHPKELATILTNVAAKDRTR